MSDRGGHQVGDFVDARDAPCGLGVAVDGEGGVDMTPYAAIRP